MTGFRVRFTAEAEEDLLRLFDFLIEQDFAAAERAAAAIAKAVELLEVFPFSCRPDGHPKYPSCGHLKLPHLRSAKQCDKASV